MNRVINAILLVGLAISSVAAVGQATVLLLDIFLVPDLRWYWGGAMAYFAAPVAFALTRNLIANRSVSVPSISQRKTDASRAGEYEAAA